MRIVIVTDAWFPQVNGVVRTLDMVRRELAALGDEVFLITPEGRRTLPCPTYAEIRLSIVTPGALGREIAAFQPCAVHIATEGPLGLAARRYCRKARLPFTTAFHTRFAEYVHARFGVPPGWTYRLLRWFHAPSAGVMVPTPSVKRELEHRGFANVRQWGRGVDLKLFRPVEPEPIDGPRPIMLYVGRVAVEKNIAAFLAIDRLGTKVVVGDGPLLGPLRTRHPEARFVGVKRGEELVRYYNAADVFVFPSRTDTFGLVLLEALACGVPVAAYPAMGPIDVVTDPRIGRLDEDLGVAVDAALRLARHDCRAFAERFSWATCARYFRDYLHPFAEFALANQSTLAETRVS